MGRMHGRAKKRTAQRANERRRHRLGSVCGGYWHQQYGVEEVWYTETAWR